MKRLNFVISLLVIATLVLSPNFPLAFADSTINPYSMPWKVEVIETYFTYNSAGMLIGQTTTITARGLNINGDTYNSVTTLTYEIINGKAVLKTSVTTAHYENPNGSKRDEVTTTNYTYDANGVLTGATGTRTFSGYEKNKKDDQGVITGPGDYYEGTATLTYELRDGEAVVTSSTTQTTSYSNITKTLRTGTSTSTTTYTYALINGAVRETGSVTVTESKDYTNMNGGAPAWSYEYLSTTYTYDSFGTITSATGSGSAAGSFYVDGQGWMVYTSDIVLEYRIVNGAAFLYKRTETRYSEAAYLDPGGNDPAGSGTVIATHTILIPQGDIHGGESRCYVLVRDAQGRIWLLRVNQSQLNSVSVGQNINFSGDLRNNESGNRILSGVTITP